MTTYEQLEIENAALSELVEKLRRQLTKALEAVAEAGTELAAQKRKAA